MLCRFDLKNKTNKVKHCTKWELERERVKKRKKTKKSYWPATDFVTNVILISSDIRNGHFSGISWYQLISSDIRCLISKSEIKFFLISDWYHLISKWRLWQNPWQANMPNEFISIFITMGFLWIQKKILNIIIHPNLKSN